ncbi:hypothetical protein CE91St41_19670 [Oscillospiraceae bacterium]|nr:hypothetical protein CE91St40_17850 [Oscillospiraceae bacterium]BDF75078.1 hypothetical protein CE91St41_19670 [Oscillospiraceae bacterium]
MFMQAVVIEVQWDHLLVVDLETRQNVIVNTQIARQFRPGDIVNIWYNGAMTKSIPPQIFALRITLAQPGQFPTPPPPVVRPPCPPGGCFPNVLPPILWPPVLFPPVVRPPVVRPPMRPPMRPPGGRPPNNRPGRPR